ncbi:hypothetical protein AVEN_167381-1 [Araneus ventricosus]|uniref:Uncharacterized protein n=1 Tax=Araneus ventricosus TaxID=182803 RepID=A0A4Y2KH34_ARAVE|nr:hypothetical protein AVEN_167381-1 [Araneus ventricosus]
MPPRSRVHFKMKKQELLSFTHSILIHRLFWKSAVEKNFISFSDYSSLWFLILYPSRNTNQEQKISSASDSKIQKLLTEKLKQRQDPRPNRPWGPQLEPKQPLLQPITKEVFIVTENDSRYRRPKPDYAKFLRDNKMAKK